MIGINQQLIRNAVKRFATVKPAPQHTPPPPNPRYQNSLRARVMRIAETVETFTVADVVKTTGCEQWQAWQCICKLVQLDKVEVVVRGGGRIPGTGRGGQTASYRRAKR